MIRVILPGKIQKVASQERDVGHRGSGEPTTGTTVCSSDTPCLTPAIPPPLEPIATAKYDLASAVIRPGILTPNQCRSVILEAQMVGMSRATILRNGKSIKNYARTCDSCWLDRNQKNEWLYEIVTKAACDISEANFGFLLKDVQKLQVLRYKPLQWFRWHVDIFPDSMRKMTAVVNLSDPSDYVGGGFRIDGNTYNKEYARDRGAGTFFPSFIRHCAKAPIWGERWVLVAWLLGPRFM